MYPLERESEIAKERVKKDVQRKEDGMQQRDEKLTERYKWLMSKIKRSSLI